MPTPTPPSYDPTKLIPPWDGILLDSAVIGSAALTGQTTDNISGGSGNTGTIGGLFQDAVSGTGDIVIAAPPSVIVTLIGIGGIGIGGTADFIVRNPVTTLIADGSLGIGGFTTIARPVLTAIGSLGIGGSGTIAAPTSPIIAIGSLGIGGTGTIQSLITPLAGIGGLGIGGDGVIRPAIVPVVAIGSLGMGGLTNIISPLIAIGSVGVGGTGTILPLITPLTAIGSLGIGGFTGIYQPETVALTARLGGTYSSADLDAIDTLIAGLKTDGVWSKLDCLYITAAPTSADALLNWKQNNFNLTVTGSPTFTANQGYSNLSASNYLRTNFVPSTAGGNFSQNSATMGVYNRVNATGSASTVSMGAISSGATIYNRLFIRDSSNGTQSEMQGTGQVTATSQTDSRGLFIVTRTASNAFRLDRNGSQIGTTATTASTGNQSVQIYVGCQNNNGTAQAGTVSTYQFSAIVLGGGLTTTDSSNLYSRIQTYMTYKGIQV